MMQKHTQFYRPHRRRRRSLQRGAPPARPTSVERDDKKNGEQLANEWDCVAGRCHAVDVNEIEMDQRKWTTKISTLHVGTELG